jgi:hypothetical protein
MVHLLSPLHLRSVAIASLEFFRHASLQQRLKRLQFRGGADDPVFDLMPILPLSQLLSLTLRPTRCAPADILLPLGSPRILPKLDDLDYECYNLPAKVRWSQPGGLEEWQVERSEVLQAIHKGNFRTYAWPAISTDLASLVQPSNATAFEATSSSMLPPPPPSPPSIPSAGPGNDHFMMPLHRQPHRTSSETASTPPSRSSH